MYNKKWIKKTGRKIYKQTGYVNPVKRGKVSSSRVLRQLPRLAADVLSLKSMVNAEKKRLEVSQTTWQPLGQVSTNASGHWIVDLTPNLAQGTGYNQKTGNSFKWHSSFMDFIFQQQVNQISLMRIKIEIVKVVGMPYSLVSDVLGKYIEPTSFVTGFTGSGVYDINSPRDPDYFKNFKVLRTKYLTIKNDQITNEVCIKRVKLGLKLRNHHVRTNDNDPTLSMGQVFMIITTDNGNCGGTASTVAGITQTAPSTGAQFRYEFTHYFYDN